MPTEDEIKAANKEIDDAANISYNANTEEIMPLPDDLKVIGITPDMLKEAAQAYNEAFVWKNPLDRLAGELALDDIDIEKKLGFKKEDGPPPA